MYTDKNGQIWYKGNLHTHTTISDGKSAPEDTLKLYASNGYDFIALTDHWKYGNGGIDEATGILVFPGCEYHTGATVQEGIYHVVCAGADREPDLDRTNGLPPVQTIITKIKEAGGAAILAHPSWSMDEASKVKELNGLDAIEIYNTMSGRPWNIRPYSGDFYDRLCADNVLLGAVAADDTHFYDGDQCVSFIYVKAESCTREALRDAIIKGDYVASQGPMLRLYQNEDGTVTAETDAPVVEFTFFSDAPHNKARLVRNPDGMTETTYKPLKNETFIRVEALDADGKYAWSSSIKLEKK